MRALLLATVICVVPACGTPLCQLPDSSSLTIRASDRLNLDPAGRSLPTIVRVYQLRDVGNFELASFDDVWESPEKVLGDSLLSKDEVTVYPNQVLTRAFDRNPEANFVVGVGIFRRSVGNTWRTVLPLPPTRSKTQCQLAQEGEDSGPPPVPKVVLELEDNQIDGTLRLVQPDSNFFSETFGAAGDAAGDAASESASDTAASSTPSAPEAPTP
jgi:type VI secretion system protein VasD